MFFAWPVLLSADIFVCCDLLVWNFLVILKFCLLALCSDCRFFVWSALLAWVFGLSHNSILVEVAQINIVIFQDYFTILTRTAVFTNIFMFCFYASEFIV